jgi:flagellar biosynthesis regulator FlbT
MDPAIKGTLALVVRELEKMNEHLAVQNRLKAIELRRSMYPSEKESIAVVDSIIREVE